LQDSEPRLPRRAAARFAKTQTTALPRCLFVAAAYVITGWIGLRIPYAGSQITLIWLPAGIAIGALLRWGRHVWPGVFVGALITNYLVTPILPLAAGIAVGNTLGPIIAVRALTSFEMDLGFRRPRDVVFLVTAGTLGAAISSAGGVLCLWLAGQMTQADTGSALLAWWMGDTTGILVFAPLLVAVSRQEIIALRQTWREVMGWLLIASVVVTIALGLLIPPGEMPLHLAFLAVPLVVWAGLRGGLVAGSAAALLITTVASVATSVHVGVFSVAGRAGDLLSLWCFITTITVTGLIMVAIQARQKLLQQEILELAFHDPLTGLANRRLVLDHLEQALAFAARKRMGALVFIDLDNFKGVNDTHGHDTGDNLLHDVAQCLRSIVRSVDTVGRMGGDEFVVILSDIGKDDTAAAVNASKIVHNLQSALGEVFRTFASCGVSASIGVTLLGNGVSSVSETLRQADEAMYCAKVRGGNAVCVFGQTAGAGSGIA